MSALSDAELSAVLTDSTGTGGSRVREVMAEVFTRHYGAVLAYARGYCRDPQTAQDLAAEAYAGTYSSVARGRGPRHAWRPYLMAVVRRTAMESARTRGRVVLPEDFAEWAERLADEVETDGALLAAEETALVARAYGSLPERWQVLLWCFVVEGEPAATVAQRMGMTPSGVRSLAARARAGRTRARTWTRTPPPEYRYRCRTPLPTGTARRPGRRRAPACHSGECPRRGRVAGDFRRADRRPEGEAPWRAGPEPVRSC
ncbi:RNA polymerase sigma factor [Kitasatospora sp. NPDC086009]|uniref:RNA polymerase sigma factor n=1 Tax=unclassified Kitasatospora TaxID=2633591 RepID=UPI0037C762BB